MHKWISHTFLIILIASSFGSTSQIEKQDLYIENLLERAKVFEDNSLDSARILAGQALRFSQKNKYKTGICKSFFRFAKQYFILGKNDSSRVYVLMTLKLSDQLKDHSTEASAYILSGSLYQVAGKKDSAFFALYKSLHLFENLRDSLNMVKVYNTLADLSFGYGEITPALNYLGSAEKILSEVQDVSILAGTYQRYGSIYYYTNEFKKAIYYTLKAKEANSSLRKERFVANNWSLLGLCYEAMDNDGPARVCFNNAMKYYTLHHCQDEIGETFFNLGVYFYNRDNNDSAVSYFKRGLAILETTGNVKIKLRLLPLLSETYSIMGNYREAYATHVSYTTLKDSLLNKEKIKQIAEVRTRYETEKKEQQIVLLNEQNKSKLAQRNFFIAGSALLLLVLLGLSLYYAQRNKISKKNELIAQEKISGLLKEQEIKSYDAMIEGQEEERKRIATDLHDRLGSMLSTVKILFGNLNEKIDIHQIDNQKQYDKASSLLDEAVLEVRRIAQNLSTGMVITFGLIPALEELCESISYSKILKCKFLCYGIEDRMEQHIEIGIFRMMQEIVNNVLKHAKAKQLIIQLNRTEDSITVTVEDDGLGFNLQEKSNGMGLKNLEARAYKMGGTYNVDSKPGHGTISIIEIPLKNDTNLNS